jgi:AcrR family transcriptional regulator
MTDPTHARHPDVDPARDDGGTRPLRADARRNRARLLDAATIVFAESGTAASLEDVARRAGLGIGTLYRHFPARDDLIEAVIHDGVDDLLRRADQLLTDDDPLVALRAWLKDVVAHAARFRGLATSMAAATCGEGRLTDACHRQEAAATALVERARRAGALRPDVRVEEVLDLVSAIAWVAEQGRPHDHDRLLDLVLDGLRVPAMVGPSPVSDR